MMSVLMKFIEPARKLKKQLLHFPQTFYPLGERGGPEDQQREHHEQKEHAPRFHKGDAGKNKETPSFPMNGNSNDSHKSSHS